MVINQKILRFFFEGVVIIEISGGCIKKHKNRSTSRAIRWFRDPAQQKNLYLPSYVHGPLSSKNTVSVVWRVHLGKWRRLVSSSYEMASSGEFIWGNGVVWRVFFSEMALSCFFRFFLKKVRLFSPPEAVGGRISPQFANSRIFPK